MFENLDQDKPVEKKAMKLTDISEDGMLTYGWFYPEDGTFWCTHGAWEADVEFIDGNTCAIFGNTKYYEFVESIPNDYNRC